MIHVNRIFKHKGGRATNLKLCNLVGNFNYKTLVLRKPGPNEIESNLGFYHLKRVSVDHCTSIAARKCGTIKALDQANTKKGCKFEDTFLQILTANVLVSCKMVSLSCTG